MLSQREQVCVRLDGRFTSVLTPVARPLRTTLYSLERIQQYVAIEQEPEPKDHGAPPAYWPVIGDLRVENLSARYSPVSSPRRIPHSDDTSNHP